jgi:Spy/CpxP family protein refolding chaperone
MPMSSGADPALTKQISDLQAQVAALQAQMSVHNQHSDGTSMAMPTSAGGTMGNDKMAAKPMRQEMMGSMSGGQSMPMQSSGMPASSMGAGSSSSGMAGMMEMMMGNMGGMGSMGAMGGGSMPSALPGFPGASHLYHIGATGFFLDHPQHLTLTAAQQRSLNQLKEQTALAQNTAERKIEAAEQELWSLTAADQPDAEKIRGKLEEIGKLQVEKRFAFIKAVGDAAKLLTDEQRGVLLGNTPAQPAMAPMKDM